VQPAEATDYAALSFDAICVAQALHWFDFAAFFAEVQRVAKPGAIFCAWGYDQLQVSPAFDAALEAQVLQPLRPFWAPQNSILWRGYADVPMPFAPIAMPAFRIEVHWNLHQLMAYVRTWSAARACEAAHGPELLAQAAQQLVPLWGDADAVRPVVMPLHTLAGRV
jgi:SAM-dependent methyltransferase